MWYRFIIFQINDFALAEYTCYNTNNNNNNAIILYSSMDFMNLMLTAVASYVLGFYSLCNVVLGT